MQGNQGSETPQYGTPEVVTDNVARTLEPARHTQHDHPPTMETTREETYGDYHIVIHTSYRIEINGVPIQGHLALTNDGRVHYHAVPNISFESAVDLVKFLIDTFPEDLPA
jgi:hypothetical protein